MIIKLLDYADNETLVDIGNLNDIAKMRIDIITGDEILNVVYKDYREVRFDAGKNRSMDFHDWSYEIYDYRLSKEANLLFDTYWLSRKDSYHYENDEYEYEDED